jgi:hypothetical protein
MRSPIRLHLARSVALCTALLICGAALGAPRDNTAKADCAQKAVLQYNLDKIACAIYPVTSIPYSECMARSARDYGNALIACALDTPEQSFRPQQFRNPGKLTIKQ